MEINLIMAHDSKGGIGKDGKLPWRNKDDMSFFAATTKGAEALNNAVVMGRTTWDSLPTPPLAGRINIVLSRTLPNIRGALVVRSATQAIAVATRLGAKELWVIGGAQTYKQFEDLGVVKRKVVTTIHGDHGCDVEYSPDTDGYAISAWHQIEGGIITEWERA
jgi:dihydrofolate reductase